MHHEHQSPPAPTPLCSVYAPMLPLLRAGSADAAIDETMRAHVETCGWCRAKLATFDIVDDALKRHYGRPFTRYARPSLEDIMDQSDHQPPLERVSPARRRTSFAGRRSPAALAVASTIALILAATVIFSLLPQRSGTPTPTPSVTATIAPTATPPPPCAQLPGGATLFTALEAVPDLELPTGTYISAPTTSGGAVGRYTVQSYMVCFPGKEADIDGDFFGPGTRPQSPPSALVRLLRLGWMGNHLFPDSYDFASLDNCTGSRLCLNDAGTPDPFTFLSVDQFFARSGGITTFMLQVATIPAPKCLNDPRYYSGTPKYTIFEQGNTATSGNPAYYFVMPPATRVSTFKGGGTTYFCSAGTTASVVNNLQFSLQTDGYALNLVSDTDTNFVATKGSHPTYHVAVNVPSPGNYSLRLFTSP